MISKEQFLELKHLKSLGVPTTTICKKIGISVPSANKWLRMDEDAFETYLRNNTPYLEQYRAFILSILKICPQTPATNIMYRIKDQFPDFDCKKNTFFRYVKTLREQTGYIKPENRPTSFREETPPGYEAQVDFGQFKMKDMYDRNLWVYFFCMVLSYSRMRFVYFSREPFRTQTAIDAHKYAFRYFGGRTQTILYDQDKVFVVSEHYGNVILVPAFEDFVCQAGFSVILCRKSDPQTKGKVESFVWYVKEGFLQGRLYTGIDSLNSAALEWLDKECNGSIHERTRKAPRESFREESKHLEKVQLEDVKVAIRAVSDKNAVIYGWSKYELPRSRVKQYDQVRIEEVDGMLMFYKADTGELIHKCRKAAEEGGDIPYQNEDAGMATVGESAFRRIFGEVEDIENFISMLREQNKRYANAQMAKIVSLAKAYSVGQVEAAIRYCLRVKICSLNEIQAYLLYRYGVGIGKRKLTENAFYHCKKRAEEIAEEQHGKLD